MQYTRRASLCAVAVTAFGLPNRVVMRLKYAPSAVWLLYKLDAAIRSAVAARFAVGFVLLDKTLPPDTFVPGQSPSQETKCFALFQRVISIPISETTVSAVATSIP